MKEPLVSVDRPQSKSSLGWLVLGIALGSLATSVLLASPFGLRDAAETTAQGGGRQASGSELGAGQAGCELWGCPKPPLENNDCMSEAWRPPPGPKTFDCPRFVVESTDQTWHSRSLEKSEAAIDKYFAPHWQSVRAFGTFIDGREGLRTFMKDWLTGFPDVFISVADVWCEGNDEVGYKTTMPYILTATNLGPSKDFGPPTGRKIKYHGIANCFVMKVDGQWQYTTEWDVPDMLSYLNAMNFSSKKFPHPPADLMTMDTCKPLFEWGTGKMNWFPKAS
jgi:hypothetical protein